LAHCIGQLQQLTDSQGIRRLLLLLLLLVVQVLLHQLVLLLLLLLQPPLCATGVVVCLDLLVLAQPARVNRCRGLRCGSSSSSDSRSRNSSASFWDCSLGARLLLLLLLWRCCLCCVVLGKSRQLLKLVLLPLLGCCWTCMAVRPVLDHWALQLVCLLLLLLLVCPLLQGLLLLQSLLPGLVFLQQLLHLLLLLLVLLLVLLFLLLLGCVWWCGVLSQLLQLVDVLQKPTVVCRDCSSGSSSSSSSSGQLWFRTMADLVCLFECHEVSFPQ
jgi:hypothetical protein